MSQDTATATATESPAQAPSKRPRPSHVNLNAALALQPLEPIRTRTKKKYRHIAAVHSKPRTSCLSHDSEVAPSFLGFRNLMVIVLSMSAKLSLQLFPSHMHLSLMYIF
jgi:diacylglycerol O-acyltransferase-1